MKEAEDSFKRESGGGGAEGNNSANNDSSGGGADDGTGGGGQQDRKRKRERGLFDPPEEGRKPIQPRHVEEAFRRLQHRNNKTRAMRNFSRSLNRTHLKLVCPFCSLLT